MFWKIAVNYLFEVYVAIYKGLTEILYYYTGYTALYSQVVDAMNINKTPLIHLHLVKQQQ